MLKSTGLTAFEMIQPPDVGLDLCKRQQEGGYVLMESIAIHCAESELHKTY